MKLLVFQHIDCEHPGQLRNYLSRDGIERDTVSFHKGQPIPRLEDYDALWVMGGPMDACDIDEYPWLIAEKEAIKQWVTQLKRPYLGFCLGHQLLAEALNGSCARLSPPEIGVHDIELTEAGVADPLFAGMPVAQKALQWHPVQIDTPPDDAIILAQSPGCANQAMRVGQNAWSMQYHAEVETDTIDTWLNEPTYKFALEISLGQKKLAQMQASTSEYLPELVENSAMLYRNFMNLISHRP